MSKSSLLMVLLYAALCAPMVCTAEEYPLTLEEMFMLADRNNKTIHTRTSALEVAAEGVREARSGRLPEIGLTLSASYLGDGHLSDRNFKNGMHVDMPHWGNNFAIEASQLIYGGGAVTNAIALARLQEQMASVELEQSRSKVRFLLTGFYLDLYKLQHIRELYNQHIALAESLIAEIRAREREGLAIENDITRFELRLKQLELERTHIENNIEILNANLVTMLGLQADTKILPRDARLEESLPIESEAHWQELAAEGSYALKQSSLAVKMSERNVNLTRADRLPKIALMAANHFDGPITIEVPVLNNNFNYWYVGLGISFKISSLYKGQKSVKRARLKSDYERRNQAEAAEQVSLAVKRDYIRYLESFEEVSTLEKSVELARQNYAIIDTRYRNDIALTTDMVDAANQRMNAELQLENARIGVLFNRCRLLHTSGKL